MRLLLTIFLFPITFYGQVAIGSSTTVHSNVILDLTNNENRGLLLNNTNPGPKKPLGNIFYNNSKNMIGVVVDTNVSVDGVNYLSPWKHTDASSDVTFTSDIGKVIIKNSIATPVVPPRVILEVEGGSINVKNGKLEFEDGSINVKNGNLEVEDGNINVKNGKLEVEDGNINVKNGKVQESGYALVPQGVIVMWTGTNAPSGWALCKGQVITFLDGTTSTAPDLRERFIVGAMGENTTNPVTGTAYAPGIGTDAGRNVITLTAAQIAPHSHELTMDDVGTHQHNMNKHTVVRGTLGTSHGILVTKSGDNENLIKTGTTDQSATGQTNIIATGAGGHTPTGTADARTTAATGHENRPPYYALAFIMKL